MVSPTTVVTSSLKVTATVETGVLQEAVPVGAAEVVVEATVEVGRALVVELAGVLAPLPVMAMSAQVR